MHTITKYLIENELRSRVARRVVLEKQFQETRDRLAEIEENLIELDRIISSLQEDLTPRQWFPAPPRGTEPADQGEVHTQERIAATKEVPEEVWYPPFQKGFGDWIDGQVPKEVAEHLHFQALYDTERRARQYSPITYRPGGFVLSKPERVVAYRLKGYRRPVVQIEEA